MLVAFGQFVVVPEWKENLARCLALVAQAREQGAGLLLLPEGVLARDASDPEITRRTAQPLDGAFMTALAREARGITVMGCVNVPDGHGRFFNTLFVLRDGEVRETYRKLHLYDAFAMRESDRIAPGDELPPVVDVCGVKVGVMTCYDVRFPEVARSLALRGAEILVVPAAWLRGPGKERHWEIMLAVRALENTCYVVAAGECGASNIGASMMIDPLGVVISALGEGPALGLARYDAERLAHVRRILPVLDNMRFAPPALRG